MTRKQSRKGTLARAVAVLALGWLALAGAPRPAAAQSAPRDNPMRQHMREMMRGVVPPPGLVPEALPAPESEGARLVARYCVQCHDLPSPRYKTALEWPVVFERMLFRMRMMARGGMMGMTAPDDDQAEAVLHYLRKNGMIPATPEQLAAGRPEDAAVFQARCAVCHSLPSPAMHPPPAWPAVVARMQGNMGLMGKTPLTETEFQTVVRFLQAAAAAERLTGPGAPPEPTATRNVTFRKVFHGGKKQ